uniref:Protein phosphatase 1 regulatory subunit 14B n=2 Tax=Timema TaxID=61471 RepID=A0A7R9JV48_TIMGE|nr:unnamed protein product [Timema genevievae]
MGSTHFFLKDEDITGICLATQTQTITPGTHVYLIQDTTAMECGLFSNSGSPSPVITEVPSRAGSGRSPAKSGLHVNFNEKGLEVKERREKFLTAKYGTHQMSLIRKRLAVEMWLYDELQKLYESSETTKSREVEVDIDELLDMDSDDRRRRHLQELLADAKKSPHEVKKFVEDLLERAKTL